MHIVNHSVRLQEDGAWQVMTVTAGNTPLSELDSSSIVTFPWKKVIVVVKHAPYLCLCHISAFDTVQPLSSPTSLRTEGESTFDAGQNRRHLQWDLSKALDADE